MEAMARPRPKYLHRETTRHGAVVWYFQRPKGPRARIRGVYGSPEFVAAYDAALAGKGADAPRKPGSESLAWLIGEYKKSSAWAALGLATQRQRNNFYKHVVALDGDLPFAAVERRTIIAGREKRASTPAQANNFIKAMRAVFAWAVDVEKAAVDPTKGVKMLSAKTDGFHVWTDGEVGAYEARWPIGTRERLAFDLLLYTGLRRGDAVKLGRQHMREGTFRIRTEKNGVWVEAPVLPALAASIAAAPTGDLSFIAGVRGEPLTKESFGNYFRGWCAAAGVPGAAHGLRKVGATRAAEAGCSERELMALYGWTDATMPSLYTKRANRATLAREGSRKLGEPK